MIIYTSIAVSLVLAGIVSLYLVGMLAKSGNDDLSGIGQKIQAERNRHSATRKGYQPQGTPEPGTQPQGTPQQTPSADRKETQSLNAGNQKTAPIVDTQTTFPAQPTPSASATPSAPQPTPPPQKATQRKHEPSVPKHPGIHEKKRYSATNDSDFPPQKYMAPSTSDIKERPETKNRGYNPGEPAPAQETPPSTPKEPDSMPADQAKIKFKKDTLFLYANNYEKQGLYTEALNEYKKALALDRTNHRILNKLAYIMLIQKRNKEAAYYAGQAVAIAPSYTPALLNLAIAYTRLGDNEKGEEYFVRAVQSAPDNAESLLNLALFYEKSNRYKDAIEVYGKLGKLGDSRGEESINRIKEKLGRKNN